MPINPLNEIQKNTCLKTVSTRAFYYLAMDAITNKTALSTIRASNPEKLALDYISQNSDDSVLLCGDEQFRQKLGIGGITCGVAKQRIMEAASQCTYFSPLFDFYNPQYDLTRYFPFHPTHLDQMYQYKLSYDQRKSLLELSGDVLILNRDSTVINNLSKQFPGIHIRALPIDNWTQAESILQLAISSKPRLTLVSAGLGSKAIGPALAKATSSVVLDIGQAADGWHLQ